MQILKTEIELNNWIQLQKSHKKTIGFVPTMGALHHGHLDLVSQSVAQNLSTIVSIFVNPKQFNNANDLKKYPITIEKDIKMLKTVNCDAVFLPSVELIYPENFKPIAVDLGVLNDVLEGPKRPGHFNGVVQVVYRLFELVKPNKAFFGLKDFQQCKVIEALVVQKFRELKLQFCPTIRQASGLAMSSRNMRLSAKGKITAANIYKVLNTVKNLYNAVDPNDALNYGKKLLTDKSIEVEYLALAKSKTLELCHFWQKENNNVVLVAAYVEGVRLIDNIEF